MFVKMSFSHGLMEGFLEGFLVYNALSQSLIILSEHFCRKFQQNIDNDKNEIISSIIGYFILDFLSVASSEVIFDTIYVRIR